MAVQAEHQAHDLASGPDADAAPEVHHRRAPLPDDTGEDSGESSGRVRPPGALAAFKEKISFCCASALDQSS